MDFGLGFSCELRIKKKKKMLRRDRFKFWEGRNCVCRADDKEMERVEGWSECWHSLAAQKFCCSVGSVELRQRVFPPCRSNLRFLVW